MRAENSQRLLSLLLFARAAVVNAKMRTSGQGMRSVYAVTVFKPSCRIR